MAASVEGNVQYDGVLVRFGELGIKSAPVRRQMMHRLRQNLLDALLRHGVEGDAQFMGSRLWMVGPDMSALLKVATHTFGVVSASQTVTCKSNMEEMGAKAIALANDAGVWTSFAIRAHREGEHKFTSMDVGRELGSIVYFAAEAEGKSPKVDLRTPDLELHVDVRSNGAFLFTHVHAGPGGLPASVQGHVVCIMDRPDSMVAAWLMMRRGCKITLAHPGDNPSEALTLLHDWGAPLRSHPLSGDDAVDAAWNGFQANAVVTAETLANPIELRPGIPVLRPLCGLATKEVDAIRRRISGAV
jgi:thiamine biosynthesis protein ThiI